MNDRETNTRWSSVPGRRTGQRCRPSSTTPSEIRHIIYTTNSVENYHRQLRKVTRTKAAFPTTEAARKLLEMATQRITRQWNAPIWEWAKILNQLAIRFEGRFEL